MFSLRRVGVLGLSVRREGCGQEDPIRRSAQRRKPPKGRRGLPGGSLESIRHVGGPGGAWVDWPAAFLASLALLFGVCLSGWLSWVCSGTFLAPRFPTLRAPPAMKNDHPKGRVNGKRCLDGGYMANWVATL